MSPGPLDISVAVGDFSPTNAGNEILASGLYGSNDLRLYSQGGTELGAFQVFSPGQNPSGTVHVGGEPFDQSGGDEILAGTGVNGQGLLKALTSTGAPLLTQQVMPPAIYGGEVHVAANR
jgi:hypothetical protein